MTNPCYWGRGGRGGYRADQPLPKGGIVVTQDYGVAALALGKGAKAIHQSGRWYTDENIDGLLMERHMAKVARRKSKNHLKGPAKRTDEDDRRFEESFRRLLGQEDG